MLQGEGRRGYGIGLIKKCFCFFSWKIFAVKTVHEIYTPLIWFWLFLVHKFSVENVFNKNLMWNYSSAESFLKKSNSGIFILYLVSVLVPIPSADALVSLLTVYEELSHRPLSRSDLCITVLPCFFSAWQWRFQGKAQLHGMILKAFVVGFLSKQINAFC